MTDPHTAEALRSIACRPMARADAMDPASVAAQLSVLPRWRLVGGALQADYRFPDWWEAIAFVNALAWMVHAQDHHPDLLVSYDRCTVRFGTHSAGGVTLNDFVCAACADAVYDARPSR